MYSVCSEKTVANSAKISYAHDAYFTSMKMQKNDMNIPLWHKLGCVLANDWKKVHLGEQYVVLFAKYKGRENISDGNFNYLLLIL